VSTILSYPSVPDPNSFLCSRFIVFGIQNTNPNSSQASALYAAQPIMTPFLGLFIGIQEGALSSLYAATSPEVETKNLW
jgi:hypothetical protein